MSLRKLGVPTVVALAVLAVGAVQLFAGALSVGVTVDEPAQALRTEGWLNQGWYVPEAFMVDGQPNPESDLSSPFVYGPAFSLVAHVANVETGNETIGGVSYSATAYAVRHLTVAALAALAVAVVGALVWFLTGAWRAGAWAAAATLAVPAWTGHAFFNVKDIPVAVGYTLVTAGLVFALDRGDGKPPGRKRQIGIAALLAAGIFIGVGTRLAIWAPVFASFVTYAALRFAQRRIVHTANGWSREWPVAIGGGLGIAFVAAAYPEAFETPRTLLVHSVSNSADYPNATTTLTAGHLLSEHPPWWYLPAWFGAQVPVLIGALAILGIAFVVRALIKSRADRGASSLWTSPQLGLVLVLQQAVLLPLLAIGGGAVMYDGMRQHLYVLPALAALAGVGAWWLQGTARARGPGPKLLATVVLSAALLVPLAEQTMLFPYNYAYVNPLAEIGGVNGRWETDYWRASLPEALSRVPRHTALRCALGLEHGSAPTSRPEFGSCAGAQLAPFWNRRGTNPAGAPDRSHIWVIASPRGGDRPPPYCHDEGDVTRQLLGEAVTMSYVLRCNARPVREATSPSP